MADYSDLDPTLLRPSVSDGTNLKPSITTNGYSGGTPSAATDLKRSICYADGTLKQSIADSVGVKASWLLSGSARPPTSPAVSTLAAIADQKAANTGGGTFTSGSWQTHDVQTEIYDTDGLISISSNQFTLAAGTYVARIRSCGHRVNSHQCRLQDVTNAVTLVLGNNASANSGSSSLNTYSAGADVFTLSGTATIELQARCESTFATNGLGLDANFDAEQYATVHVFQVA